MKISIDKADTVFSQYVRKRDSMCLRCLSPVKFNAKGLPVSHTTSHFQGRRKEGTRFDEFNAVCLCMGCHSYFTANPAEHYVWQVKRLGQESVNELVLRSNMYHKKDRNAEYLYWKNRLKEDFNL